MLHTLWRVARAGLAAAAILAAGGWALGRSRYGVSDQDAVARIEIELRQRFAASGATLGRIASQLGAERISVGAAPRRLASTRSLFEAVTAALPPNDGGRTGITIYDSLAAPVAWAGRTSDVPRQRLDGPAALFVAPDALGPRLVRVEPVIDRSRPAATRLATIVAEQQLGPVRGAPGLADTFIISTEIVPILASRSGRRRAAAIVQSGLYVRHPLARRQPACRCGSVPGRPRERASALARRHLGRGSLGARDHPALLRGCARRAPTPRQDHTPLRRRHARARRRHCRCAVRVLSGSLPDPWRAPWGISGRSPF